jgi:hypothetical protein
MGRPDYTAEETPNSGGWQVATESYYANNVPATLAAQGAPQMNYGLDGEGRTAAALDANGYHDVSAASYGISGSSLSLSLTLGTAKMSTAIGGGL